MDETLHLPRRSLIIGSAAVAGGLVVAPAGAAVTEPRATFAVWDPVSGRSTATLRPRRVTVHIAVTRSKDIYGPGKGGGGTYAHFYNPRSGRPRQHQALNRQAVADYRGNPTSISVEHAGIVGDSMTASQIENMGRIFAWAVLYCGVPNRIATVGNTSGLAWHRLGVSGSFGRYDPKDRTTWSRAQTGEYWSTKQGKECPTNRFIRQIPRVFDEAQYFISLWTRPGPKPV